MSNPDEPLIVPAAESKQPASGVRVDHAGAYRSGQVIMLGFTGSIGSGCTFLAKGIKEVLGSDAHYFRLSEHIRSSLAEKGNRNPSVAELQDEGNRLRREKGLTYLVERCVAEIVKKEDDNVYNENSVILIDGIRNTNEVRSLRVNPNFGKATFFL